MSRLLNSTPVAIMAVMAFLVVIWYGAAVYLNSDVLIDKYERQKLSGIFSYLLVIHGPWAGQYCLRRTR